MSFVNKKGQINIAELRTAFHVDATFWKIFKKIVKNLLGPWYFRWSDFDRSYPYVVTKEPKKDFWSHFP